MFDNVFSQIPNSPSEIIEFVFVFVIIRGVFSKWLGSKIVKYIFKPLAKIIKHRLIKSERDVAIWLHYRNKALKKGHHHDDPIACNDGKCILL